MEPIQHPLQNFPYYLKDWESINVERYEGEDGFSKLVISERPIH